MQAPLDNGEKWVSNQIKDADQDQHNKGPKENMWWAPMPKQLKKSWGNIVQKHGCTLDNPFFGVSWAIFMGYL